MVGRRSWSELSGSAVDVGGLVYFVRKVTLKVALADAKVGV